jgi:ABC-2 type transport system permease protein
MQTANSQPISVRIRHNWIALTAMVYKELIIMTRYPVNFVASFFQIFFIIAVFTLAGLTFSEDPQGGSDTIISSMMATGFILYIYISDTLWTIGYNVRREQIEGTLEQLYLSPANKFANLVSRVTNLLIWTSLLCVVALLVLGSLLGGLSFQNPLLGLYILLMSLLGTFGMGFAFAALTLRIKETASTLVNLLQFGLMILCAMFFPFASLPDWLIAVSRLIPVSYMVDAFRSTLMGYPTGFPELAPIGVEIAIVTVFGLLMPVLGYYLYRWAEDAARRKGTLAEY